MAFVSLLEEHKDAICKSQVADLKKKKEEALLTINKKWAEISGKTLTQSALMKKINNKKSRTKTAIKEGKPLADWQIKMKNLLTVLPKHNFFLSINIKEMFQKNQGDNREELKETKKMNTPRSGNNEGNAVTVKKVIANDYLNSFEIEETKSLSNYQLQRIALLEQIKVLGLQKKRLEAVPP